MNEFFYRSGLGLMGAVSTAIGRAQPTIFCYHSVTNKDQGAGFASSISVDCSYFERLIDFTRRHKTPIISLPEALEDLARKRRAPSLVLTFDDGYEDNYSAAFPLFRAEGIPFTIFVTTGLVDQTAPLWWDALERLEANPQADLPDRGTGDRIKKMPPAEQRAALHTVLRQAGLSQTAPYQRALKWPQLREMSRSGLLTVGAHTVTHPMLSRLDDEDVTRELKLSKERLEEELALPVRYLAYPYGQPHEVGESAPRIAEQLGYAAAFTTDARPLRTSDHQSLYQLPRVLLARKAQRPTIAAAYMSGTPRRLRDAVRLRPHLRRSPS